MLRQSRRVSFLPLLTIDTVCELTLGLSIGAQSILRAFTRSDFPSDPDQIFLTSWGEWWGKDTIEKSLDKKLQDKWCPSTEEIEAEEGITA